jgi:hypothetical protein
VTTATLSVDLSRALGALFGRAAIETLGGFADAVGRATGGEPLGVEDLCHVAGR